MVDLSKLSQQQVDKIVDLYSSGNGAIKIERMTGIDEYYIYAIVKKYDLKRPIPSDKYKDDVINCRAKGMSFEAIACCLHISVRVVRRLIGNDAPQKSRSPNNPIPQIQNHGPSINLQRFPIVKPKRLIRRIAKCMAQITWDKDGNGICQVCGVVSKKHYAESFDGYMRRSKHFMEDHDGCKKHFTEQQATNISNTAQSGSITLQVPASS